MKYIVEIEDNVVNKWVTPMNGIRGLLRDYFETDSVDVEQFELTDADLKELQNIADKWTDPKTQEELYLGRCVKAAYAKGYDVNASVVYTSDRFKTLDQLIEWGKQQGVE